MGAITGVNLRSMDSLVISVLLTIISTVLVRGESATERKPTKNIAEIVSEDPRFTTLLAAVKAAGLAGTLSGPGKFTVFAPTDDAFAKIPSSTLNSLISKPEDLKAVLLRHVSTAIIPLFIIKFGENRVHTVGGEYIMLLKDKYRKVMVESSAGTAMVINPHIGATNGIIHAVDTVF